jgi:ABC-type transport system involved in multi-copper enzyme maturation permease subunit
MKRRQTNASERPPARGGLLRYNFRVMIYNNWWLLVFPLAASQFAVFWSLITQRFQPWLPAQCVEFTSPLLAAFLAAHVLTAEYRSGVGAILASKPVDLKKIVALRLGVVMALVWALAGLSLAAFYYGMEPYPWAPAFLAIVPTTLWLAMLALTFATLFRHPLAGFGVAALYWALDLPPGAQLMPFLSLRTYSLSLPMVDFAELVFAQHWYVAKIVLLLGAVALYASHSRLIFTLGSPITVRVRRRAAAFAASVVVVYIGSGALFKVGYAYTQRGRLQPSDAAWLRRHFSPYGPIPITALFGPTFRALVGDIPNSWRANLEGEADLLGDTAQHRRALKAVLDSGDKGPWAASVADLYARLEVRSGKEPDDKLKAMRIVLDRFPKSVYAAYAQQQSARILADAGRGEEAGAAYQQLLRMPVPEAYRMEALKYLTQSALDAGDVPRAERMAGRWVDQSPDLLRFPALAALADALHRKGDLARCRTAAAGALDAIAYYERNKPKRGNDGIVRRTSHWELEAGAIAPRMRGYLGQ